jgi:hypothetical protein
VFDVMKLDFRKGGNKKKAQGRVKKANNDQGDDWAWFCQDRNASSAQSLASSKEMSCKSSFALPPT